MYMLCKGTFILTTYPSPPAQKTVMKKKKIMKSVDVVTKICFAAKRRVSQLENLAKARTVKSDQPEENEDDMGPLQKIATRSKQVCS